jgi:hypothetical protein
MRVDAGIDILRSVRSTRMSGLFWILYIGLRSVEGLELAIVTYGTLGQPLTAAYLMFLFAFAVTAATVAAKPLGRRAALCWHVAAEIILLPLFVLRAFDAISRIRLQETPLANWPEQSLIWLVILAFLSIQFAVSLAGVHIIKWASSATSIEGKVAVGRA